MDEITVTGLGETAQRATLGNGRIPVSVSTTDRTDVRFLWDEADHDPLESAERRLTLGLDRAQRDHDQMRGQMLEQQFAGIADPEHRRILAEQLRAQGIAVPEMPMTQGGSEQGSEARLAKLAQLLARGVNT